MAESAACALNTGQADMQSVIVPSRSLPVLAEADIVVCGRGPAGVAPAISAARHGARGVLLERWPNGRGQATNAPAERRRDGPWTS